LKRKYDAKKPPILYPHTQAFLKKRSEKIQRKENAFAKKTKKSTNAHEIPFEELSDKFSM